MTKRITINNFMSGTRNIHLCNTGHITNGAWAVNPKLMPKIFKDFINKINLKNNLTMDLQRVLDQINTQNFCEIFRLDAELQIKEEFIFFQSKDKILKTAFSAKYILWLEKNIPKIKILAFSPDQPAKLILKGAIIQKIGLLMPFNIEK